MTFHWLALAAFGVLVLGYRSYQYHSREEAITGERGYLLMLVSWILLASAFASEGYDAVPPSVTTGLWVLTGIAILGSFVSRR